MPPQSKPLKSSFFSQEPLFGIDKAILPKTVGAEFPPFAKETEIFYNLNKTHRIAALKKGMGTNSKGLFNFRGKMSWLIAAVVVGGFAGTAFGHDAARGKVVYQVCTACHGAGGEGNKAVNAPHIAGLNAWYVEAQLNKFRSGMRGTHPRDIEGMQMRPMSLTIATEDDVKNVAEYVETLKPNKGKTTIKGNSDRGKNYYAVCMACHGDKGQGNQALNSPPLVRLNDWYILSQLKKFRSGVRGTNPEDITGMQMQPMSMTLPNEQAMLDVIAYINTLWED